jgi:hypothetical protein
MKMEKKDGVRTDIHSPKNFNPGDYEYVGAFNSCPEPMSHMGEPAEYEVYGEKVTANNPRHANYLVLTRKLSRSKFKGNWDAKGQCDHCGARFIYVVVYKHKPTGDHIAVGEDCSHERFSFDSRVAYDIKREKREAALARERAKREKEVEKWLTEYEDLRAYLVGDKRGTHHILDNMGKSLKQWGRLTDKQVEFARKLVAESKKPKVKAKPENKSPAPEGKVTVEGEVVAIKWQENMYGGCEKMVVKTKKGWAVWVTVPQAICDLQRGDIVRFSATLKRSDRDKSFAFGKRPTKATYVEKKERIA